MNIINSGYYVIRWVRLCLKGTRDYPKPQTRQNYGAGPITMDIIITAYKYNTRLALQFDQHVHKHTSLLGETIFSYYFPF